jgi:deoxyribose-phosphate aldolase
MELDFTLLRPDASKQDVLQHCIIAAEKKYHAVCLHPFRLALAREVLRGTGVGLATVVGFPFGADEPDVKLRQAQVDADEIDYVVHLAAMRDSLTDPDARKLLRREVRYLSQIGKPLKAILETGAFTVKELDSLLPFVVKELGPFLAFLKTSTGYYLRDGKVVGAELDKVRLLAHHVKDTRLRIKASGGIRDRQTAEKFIAAGASRIGTSVAI